MRFINTRVYNKHGDGRKGRKHLLYGVWAGMHSRCSNPNSTRYKFYGAKGVTVCLEWKEYPAFKTWALAAGYRRGLQIDRIDTFGNYSPANCRWVPRRINLRNRRNSHYITCWGETKVLAEWAEDSRCVVSYATLKKRLYRGMTAKSAMTRPI